MKSLFRLPALIAALFLFHSQIQAQAPGAIPYQAVARNGSGNLIAGQTISLRFSIHDATAGGTIVYQETQSATTNTLGLFSVNIGQGSVVSGTFSTIDWGSASKFMQVELDVAGGSSYVDMGTQQMLSVPYALYAASGGTAYTGGTGIDVSGSTITNTATSKWTATGNKIYNSNSGNVGIGTSDPGSLFHVKGIDNTLVHFESSSVSGTGLLLDNTSSTGSDWTILSTGTSTSGGGGNFIIREKTGITGIRLFIETTTGEVGIGTTSPASKLHVNGTAQATLFKMTGGNPAAGRILQSDASGLGSWVEPSSLTVTETDPQVSAATTNQIPKWNGSTLSDGLMTDDGTNIGIGTTTPAEKLDVDGVVQTKRVKITEGSPAAGYVLQSDAAGLGAWVDPASLSVTEVDPQVSSTTSTAVPHWNGSTLSDGLIYDNGTSVGIGTSLPESNFHVKSTDNTLAQFESSSVSGTTLLLKNTSTSGNGWSLVSSGSSNLGGAGNLIIRELSGPSGIRMFFKTTTGEVGIGTTTPGSKLDVNGTAQATLFKMTGGSPAAGRILQSDASGLGSWVEPSSLTVTETDPQVSAATTNQIPKWNGAALTDGSISDDGTNIGIGTSSPNSTLEVNGAVALKFKSSLIAGTDNPDATGAVWRYSSGSGTITLPAASGCPNRMYTILNQTGVGLMISSYYDLSATSQTTVANGTALWLMSDGTGWYQIK